MEKIVDTNVFVKNMEKTVNFGLNTNVFANNKHIRVKHNIMNVYVNQNIHVNHKIIHVYVNNKKKYVNHSITTVFAIKILKIVIAKNTIALATKI